MTIGYTSVKGSFSDFGENVHLGKFNGRYVLLVDTDSTVFEKGVSQIEFHKPDNVMAFLERIRQKEKNLFLDVSYDINVICDSKT